MCRVVDEEYQFLAAEFSFRAVQSGTPTKREAWCFK